MFIGLYIEDVSGNLVFGMVESFEVSEDGLIWIFILCEVSWFDGQLVIVYDFVFVWCCFVDLQIGV